MIRRSHTFVPSARRFPQFERPLAEAVPADAKSVVVLGRAAHYAADRISALRPDAAVRAIDDLTENAVPAHPAEAAVLSDPLPHSAKAEHLLCAAMKYLDAGGVVVAAFENGATEENLAAYSRGCWIPSRKGADAPYNLDKYCWRGVEVLLSRCDLEPVAALAVEGLLPSKPSPETAAVVRAAAGPYDGDLELLGWVVVTRTRARSLLAEPN
jgi:hypothetical protein